MYVRGGAVTPRDLYPMPYYAFQNPPRLVSDDEVVYLQNLVDRVRQRRPANMCMMCNNNQHEALVTALCCLTFMCVPCCLTHFNTETVSCPSCGLRITELKIQDVFLSPLTKEKPKTADEAKSLIHEWNKLVKKIRVSSNSKIMHK